MEESQIKLFFKNQTIFLTGGSGFLGKVLLEKILRECDEIKKIYLLIRPKKSKTAEERFVDLSSYPCFDVLKTKNPDSLKKVSLISGDCQQPSLGLSQNEVEVLVKETTCVLHVAANVKFDQTVREAACNVRATRDVLELAKKMINLKVLVYVSTAFSNCIYSHIEEKFYDPPLKAEKLFELVDGVDDVTLEAITPALIGKRPNTYVFAKSICEDLIRSFGTDLPVTIVRPAIVGSSMAEPFPGWIDNFYGVVGAIVGSSLGIIKSAYAKRNAKAVVVPVDGVCNCILAAAWKREGADSTTIYNYVTHRDNELTWCKGHFKAPMFLNFGIAVSFEDILKPNYHNFPSQKALWYYCFKIRENRTWHYVCVFLFHTVQAYIVDCVLFCLGKHPIAVKNYKRLDKMLDLGSYYFTTNEWLFDYDNVTEMWDSMNAEDKKLFNFDIKHIDWEDYYHKCCLGVRIYLLKDPIETIPNAKRKQKILFVVHYTIIALFYYLLYKFLMFLLGFFL